MERNVVGWFEIPVEDMARAVAFYEAVFGFELERHTLGPLEMAWFPMQDDAGGAAGSLVRNENYTPSRDGILVYFTSPSGDLRNELGQVEEAGGTVLMDRKQVSEDYGYIGIILDTEGNRIGVHSRQ